MIYFTTDLHFCHDLSSLFEPRGFKTIEEHDKKIVENWNEIVTEEDEVYVLGDLMMNDTEKGIELIKQLKGKIHLIVGNHDTNKKLELIKTQCSNIVSVNPSLYLKYRGYTFYLSHYPSIIHFNTATIEYIKNKFKKKNLIINLFGHTHQKEKFYKDNVATCMYHVGLDSHENKVVSIEQIVEDFKERLNKDEVIHRND